MPWFSLYRESISTRLYSSRAVIEAASKEEAIKKGYEDPDYWEDHDLIEVLDRKLSNVIEVIHEIDDSHV